MAITYAQNQLGLTSISWFKGKEEQTELENRTKGDQIAVLTTEEGVAKTEADTPCRTTVKGWG